MRNNTGMTPRMELSHAPALKWVKLKHYCALSGDTPYAVHAKRRKGSWLEGIHCQLGPDGNVWVNLVEVETWVENSNRSIASRVRQA